MYINQPISRWYRTPTLLHKINPNLSKHCYRCQQDDDYNPFVQEYILWFTMWRPIPKITHLHNFFFTTSPFLIEPIINRLPCTWWMQQHCAYRFIGTRLTLPHSQIDSQACKKLLTWKNSWAWQNNSPLNSQPFGPASSNTTPLTITKALLTPRSNLPISKWSPQWILYLPPFLSSGGILQKIQYMIHM